MQNYLAEFGSWVTVIQGVIFVFCVLAFRRGIVGAISSYAARLGKLAQFPRRAAGAASGLSPQSRR